MKIIQPDDIQIHFDVPPVMSKTDRVAIDTEIFRIPQGKLHRPVGDFACATFCADGMNVYIVFNTDELQQTFDNIDEAVHVYHNAQFDIKQLRRWVNYPDRKKIWDTMLIEQLMYGGYYNDFALNDLARRWCGLYLPKAEQKSFSHAEGNRMTDEQIFYAACDTVATWMIYKEQAKAVDDTDYKIWTDVERSTLFTLISMNGIHMDVPKWERMAQDNLAQAEKIKSELPINPASPKQVKDALKKEGFDVDKTDENALSKLNGSEIADKVLAYRAFAKKASTYGVNFLEDKVENEMFWPTWFQQGAETGRMSGNAQQMPHDAEYRSCFIAAPGNKLIVADYSSQEPRIAAFLSQDREMIDIFNSGRDIYIEVAHRIYHEEITKQDPRRQMMKSLVLGTCYGMSAFGLSEKINASKEEAQELLDQFYSVFTGLADWTESQREFAKTHGYVTTILGRKIWLNMYNSQWERNALNAPVQGSAAEITKLAGNVFVKRWGANPMRLFVHDELVVEISEMDADEAAKLLNNVMVTEAESLHVGVPAKTEVFIGDNWACKS